MVCLLFGVLSSSSILYNAVPTSSKVLVNGEVVAFDAYNINGSNYFKLRDLAKILSGTEKQFEVTWNNENKAIELISDKAYTAVGVSWHGAANTVVIDTAVSYED